MNSVDVVILLVLIWFVYDGWKKGIFWLLAQLVAFFGAILVAFRTYGIVTGWLTQLFNLSHGWAKAIGFVLTAGVMEHVIYEILSQMIVKIPKKFFPKWWRGLMSVGPALISGAIFVAFMLTAIVSLPIKPQIKRTVLESKIGGWLVTRTIGMEQNFAGVFGEAARETLTFLTIPVKSGERINLGIDIPESHLRVDPESEAQMFSLVNAERRKAGARELEWFGEGLVVARTHSEDMLKRSYFSHYSPEGEDVGDRLQKAGISYVVAGENLALAPTITVAHDGLMNSPGHRTNILSPEFSRVVIGVIDGGVYGKMVTQVFLN